MLSPGSGKVPAPTVTTSRRGDRRAVSRGTAATALSVPELLALCHALGGELLVSTAVGVGAAPPSGDVEEFEVADVFG